MKKNCLQKPVQEPKKLNEEIIEIKSQISKLKDFCSNKKKNRSFSKDLENEENTANRKNKKLSIEELECDINSNEKCKRKPRDITPKVRKSLIFI